MFATVDGVLRSGGGRWGVGGGVGGRECEGCNTESKRPIYPIKNRNTKANCRAKRSKYAFHDEKKMAGSLIACTVATNVATAFLFA